MRDRCYRQGDWELPPRWIMLLSPFLYVVHLNQSALGLKAAMSYQYDTLKPVFRNLSPHATSFDLFSLLETEVKICGRKRGGLLSKMMM